MEKLFLTVLKMSVTSSYVILFVLIARLLLKKCPKIFSYMLWAVVLFRLIVPVIFESSISFMPRNTSMYLENNDINSSVNNDIKLDYNNYEVADADNFANNENSNNSLINKEKNNTSTILITSIATFLWLLVSLIITIYSFYSFIKLNKRLKNSKYIEDNIYESEYIETAFVMGALYPRIYIPVNISHDEKKYILTHERIHIKRSDNIIKIIFFLVSALHWFNPLVWISFILMSKDMEMSCDEAVVKSLGNGIKKEYSMSLLAFASDRKMLAVTPIAFGEGDVKSRIKNVLKYKKPRFWIIILSITVVITIGLGLMFNPINNEESNKYLDINNTLDDISTTDEVIIRRIGEGGYIWQGETFSENFKSKIKGLKEHKAPSAYELSADIIVYIYGDSDYVLSFYESEPKLMKVSYYGESRYYKSLNDMYTEMKLMSMLVSNWTPEEIVVAVMDGKKTNKTSYDDRPRGVDYLELSIGNNKYFIYEDKGKYYVERPYVAIYKISEEVYENAKKFAVEPEQYTENTIDEAFIEDLVCKTVEEQELGFTKEDILIISPKIFGYYEEENKVKVFTTVKVGNFSLSNNIVEAESGGIIPIAITYVKNRDGRYSLIEYLEAMDGGQMESSIKEFCNMPVSGKNIEGLADKILGYNMDYSEVIHLEKERLI